MNKVLGRRIVDDLLSQIKPLNQFGKCKCLQTHDVALSLQHRQI
jgi:hypothetical protein